MTAPTPLAFGLVVVAAWLGAMGQFLFREGSTRATSLLPHPLTMIGACCYVVVMVLFNRAFRGGGSVPVLYPVYASTFAWAVLIGHVVYGQPILPRQVGGMTLLLAGIWLMASH